MVAWHIGSGTGFDTKDMYCVLAREVECMTESS